MIIVQKDDGKLSQVLYYKADIEDYDTFKKIAVWRGHYRLIYAKTSVYFNINLTATKNLKGIILGFKGYNSTYDHQFDILVEVQEYDGTSWNTVASKSIKFPPDLYYKDGDTFIYCDVAIVYDIEFDTPVALDSSKQYRVQITPTENVYIVSMNFYGDDGTDYIYRILYSDEVKNYESGDVIVVRGTLEMDVDTLEYYDQRSSYYYDRYVSVIILPNGVFKITNNSPDVIKFKGSIIRCPSPSAKMYIGTEEEPISKDKKITIYFGYGITSYHYGGPWQMVADGFYIYTEKVSQEEAVIVGYNALNEIIFDGILDKWNTGDEICIPVLYAGYAANVRRTITGITYDTENSRTIVTLNSNLPGKPFIGEKAFLITQSVEIRGYMDQYVRYFSTAYESLVKYDRVSEVLKGVRLVAVYFSAKNVTDDSYVVIESPLVIKLWRSGTLLLTDIVSVTMYVSAGGYIKKLVLINCINISLNVYSTTVSEYIAYNCYYAFGSESYINDIITINKFVAKSVRYVFGTGTNTLTVIKEIIVDNVESLFNISASRAGGIFRIGLLRGSCKQFGTISIASVVIEKTTEINPFEDPFPVSLLDSWRGYLDVRIYNIAGLSNTGMYSDGQILIVSTGDGLSDTTKKSGRRAYKVLLRYGYGKISYTMPVLQENSPIALQLAVKPSETFVSSANKLFKVQIIMPDGSIYEKEITDFTADWQYVTVSGFSSVKGTATIVYEMQADPNSYVYIDDEVLLTGYIVDMSGAETWQGGMPAFPPIKTFMSGLAMWNVSLDALTVPNTVGNLIKLISKVLQQHDLNMKAELSQIKGSGFDETADSLEKIRKRLDEIFDATTDGLDKIKKRVDEVNESMGNVLDKIKKHDAKLDAYKWL